MEDGRWKMEDGRLNVDFIILEVVDAYSVRHDRIKPFKTFSFQRSVVQSMTKPVVSLCLLGTLKAFGLQSIYLSRYV